MTFMGCQQLVVKPDLDSGEHIRQFVQAFYQLLLQDPQLAPFFVDVDLPRHLPLISQYWEKLLLAEPGYSRHTMNIHRALNRRKTLQRADYVRWLAIFAGTLESGFCGAYADRAKKIAEQVAANMERALRH